MEEVEEVEVEISVKLPSLENPVVELREGEDDEYFSEDDEVGRGGEIERVNVGVRGIGEGAVDTAFLSIIKECNKNI